MSDLDPIVRVTSTVTDKSPTRASFGTPMLAGRHTAWIDRVRDYAEASEMLDDGFTTSSPLYNMALALKAQDPAPPQFKVGRLGLPYTQTIRLFPTVTTEGYVYTFTIGPSTITYTVLAAATIATICTALELLVEAVTGIASTATATYVEAVSDVGALNPYSWSYGLNVIDMTVNPGVETDLAAIAEEDNDWYGLALDCNSDAIVKAAALWTEANGKQFVYQSGDWDIADAGQTTDLATDMVALGYHRSMLIWHRFIGGTEWAAVAWLSVMLGDDPGAATPAFKSLAGISTDTLRTGEFNAIQAKNGNTYDRRHGANITFEGRAASGRFFDIPRFVDWQDEQIRVDLYQQLINARKVGMTKAGLASIQMTGEASLVKGINAGGISQDVAPEFIVPDITEVPISERAARRVTNIKYRYRLSGALHGLTVDGTISV
jgi:hypothetical protein